MNTLALHTVRATKVTKVGTISIIIFLKSFLYQQMRDS